MSPNPLGITGQHYARRCRYCAKLCGDAYTCVAHAPLLMLDPDYSPAWVEYMHTCPKCGDLCEPRLVCCPGCSARLI